ncbi:MAG: hypothetical protein HRT99_00320 [Mycoplasmatales bacterium]|nr:hypothetical protein [Mycoplasmatales bacterium]
MKRTILKFGTTIPMISSFAFIVSCSANQESSNWDKNVSINLKTTQLNFDKGAFKIALENEINKIIDEKKIDKPHVSIDIQNNVSDDYIIVDNVVNRKYDFGISSIASINNFSKEGDLLPLLQTETKKFIWDKGENYYLNGKENDPLYQQAILGTESLKNYQNISNSEFDGSIYKKYYQNSFTPFYRGMILICGNNDELKEIRKSWDDKNWEKFLSFGIIHGNNKSGGKFILQEKLLKKHFGKNSFETLSQEFLDNPSKNKNGKAKDIGKDENYKIAFDDEGSFVWTNKALFDKPFQTTDQNKRIELLMVTEPIKYDVGFFRSNFNNEEGKIIAEAFINLAKNNNDTYGPKIGYYNYESITDSHNEVYKKFEKVMR